MTAMQDLRQDLMEAILKVNNRVDFLDNVSDPKVRELCTIMVNVTLEGIIKRIDSELLDMEKEQLKKERLDGYVEGINSASTHYPD